MRRGRKIWLKVFAILLSVILLIIILLFLFRNIILVNVLPSLINNESDEKITLELDNASVSLNGDAYLLNTSLGFSDTYLDKAESIKLLQLTFDTIFLYGASYSDVIKDGLFSADSLLLISPKVKISKEENGGKTEFHPDNILALLGSEIGNGSIFPMKVAKIVVDKGEFKMDLLQKTGDKDQSVDFRVNIENFSTLPEDNLPGDKILFADDIEIEIANIEKFEIAGYDIDLGSLLFSIKDNKLEINGIDLFPTVVSDSIDQIALAAEKIEFNGLSIHEISGKEEIELHSARIFNGNFISNTNYTTTSERDAHNRFFSSFSNNFRQFNLDTLGIHNFDIEVLEFLEDTITFVNNIGMELYGVLIDSSMMDDIYRELVFDEFVLNTGSLGNYKLPNDLRVSADSLAYNSSIEEASLFNILFSGNNSYSDHTPLHINIDQIRVDGISEDPIPAPLKMHLTIELDGIKGKVDPGGLSFEGNSSGAPNTNIFEFIQIDTLSIANTDLRISDNHIRIANIGLMSKSLQIRRIAFVSDPAFGENLTEIGSISLEGFELEKLISENALHVNEINLNSISTSGRFNLHHAENSGNALPASFTLPFESIYIGHTALTNVILDNTVSSNEREYSFNSQLDVEIPEFHKVGRYFERSDLLKIEAKIGLHETAVNAMGYKLAVDDLNIDLQSGDLVINRAELGLDGLESHENRVLLNEIHMPQFSIQGFDMKQALMMEQFSIEGCRHLEFKSLILQDMTARLTIQSDTGIQRISVEGLSLGYKPNEEHIQNFMESIAFSFGQTSYEETNNNTHVSVGLGTYDARKKQLILRNIQGSDIDRSVDIHEHNNGWEYSSEELILSGLYARNTIPTSLGVHKLSLSDASVKIMTDLDSRANTKMEFDLEGFRRVGDLMTRLSIDTTVFEEINLKYISVQDSLAHVFLADSIGLTMSNIDVDTSIFDHPEPSVLKRMNIDLKGRTTISRDSLYEIRSGLISYDFDKDVITIDSFQVIPRFADTAFFARVGYQTDRMQLSSNEINLYDFRLGEFLQDKLIHFGRVDIDGVRLDMVRDKTYARKVNDFKPMPQDMLRQLPHKITLDSVRVFNSYVQYGEYVEKSSVPGTVFFDRFNLRMYNLSSDLPRPDPTTALKVDLNAYVMGGARFDLSIVFPYVGKLNNFWLSAASEEIDLTSLNPVTQSALGLSIKDGTGYIENATINGDSIHTRGSMIFRYKDLKLSMYNRKKAEQNKGLFGAITRFLINDIVIHKNNPRFAREARTGQVYFERDREKAILNYVWKSLLSGMLSSIGINKKEQRQERKDMKKLNQPN